MGWKTWSMYVSTMFCMVVVGACQDAELPVTNAMDSGTADMGGDALDMSGDATDLMAPDMRQVMADLSVPDLLDMPTDLPDEALDMPRPALDAAPDLDMEPEMPTRSFLLGFTVWPYDLTLDAIDDTYQRIERDADLYTHHLMGGIPWDDALVNGSYSANIETDICSRLQRTYPNDGVQPDALGRCYAPDRQDRKAIYLAIDNLTTSRDALVGYWGASEGEPLSAHAPWDQRDFDHPDVIDAYAHFASEMITRFKPGLFNLGTEASELLLHDPERFARYVVFVERVVAKLKASHPGLPLMVSVALKAPDSPEAATMEAGFGALVQHVDVLGISVYPYVFFEPRSADPALLPVNWLSQVDAYRQGRPLAVTETAWIAQDLDVPDFFLSVPSNAAFQSQFVSALFEECERLSCVMINWFTIVDYDALWEKIGFSALAAIWRDTGLFDETLQPRPSLDIWREWRQREVVLP